MSEQQLSLFEQGEPIRGRTRSEVPVAIVVLSGGQDSTTCLFWAKHMGFEVHAVTFDYNQRHRREIEAAKKVAELASVLSHEIIEMGPILKGTSPLVSDNTLEQYASHEVLPGGLEKTFVPMRNQLFLTISANRAYIHKAEALVTGVCEEDYGGYPDCRQQFIHALSHACNLGTFTGEDGAPGSLAILTPLMKLTKAATVDLALALPGCYAALAWTHTSYDGAYPPVGHDHATLLRQKGFEQAGVPDPLVVRAWYEDLMDLPKTENYSSIKAEQHLDQLVEYFSGDVK
jgi:7-cyano-7-deazaguanine synthase